MKNDASMYHLYVYHFSYLVSYLSKTKVPRAITALLLEEEMHINLHVAVKSRSKCLITLCYMALKLTRAGLYRI